MIAKFAKILRVTGVKTGVRVLIFGVNRSRIGVEFCNFGAGLESESQKSDSGDFCHRLVLQPLSLGSKKIACAISIFSWHLENFHCTKTSLRNLVHSSNFTNPLDYRIRLDGRWTCEQLDITTQGGSNKNCMGPYGTTYGTASDRR